MPATFGTPESQISNTVTQTTDFLSIFA
jgi:hypothetical protein